MYKKIRLICLTVLMSIMLLLSSSNASAALARCRTDPIFVLSNGDVLSVTVDLSTTAANVRNISYILHVPAGVTVKNVVYTNLNLRIPETYQVRQGDSAKTYTVDTVVTTQNAGKVAVTVFGRLNGGIRKSVSGVSGQPLFMTLYKP